MINNGVTIITWQQGKKAQTLIKMKNRSQKRCKQTFLEYKFNIKKKIMKTAGE